VFLGERAIQAGVHFHFHVAGWYAIIDSSTRIQNAYH
jgi:urease beta subunit